jgi:RNA polymerase sigma factor (sigma-70 family)
VNERDTEARIDADLVERARREGDPRVFGLLVRRHQGAVRAQLRRLLHGDAASADDLAQETFLLAWRKLDQFRGEARFATWLYRIAHTCFLQHVRASRPQSPDDEVIDADASEALHRCAEALTLKLDLAAALNQLSMNQRAALLYCVQLGLSHEETSVVMGVPLGTVKTHVARGKARLRLLLED